MLNNSASTLEPGYQKIFSVKCFIPNRYQVNNIAFGIIATKLSSLPAKSYLDSKLVLNQKIFATDTRMTILSVYGDIEHSYQDIITKIGCEFSSLIRILFD